MKISKAQGTIKKKKTSQIKKEDAGTKVISARSVLREEEIRKKAEELYHERIARGEHGTPESDWFKAEELLKGSNK